MHWFEVHVIKIRMIFWKVDLILDSFDLGSWGLART